MFANRPHFVATGREPVNEAGAQFYSDLIDLLLENGKCPHDQAHLHDECFDSDIVPFVTLYHWDLPEA